MAVPMRTRVANAEEAAALIAALDPADAVPYALAFYAGLRRAEIPRLDWPDVELDGYRLVVRKAKSASARRQPIAEPLRPILLNEFCFGGSWGRLSKRAKTANNLSSNAR